MFLLTAEAPTAQQIASEVTEEMVSHTADLFDYINSHIPNMISFGIKLLFSLVLFFLGRIFIRWARRFMKRALERSNADKGVEQFIDSLLKFFLYALLLFMIVQNLGVSSSSIAALIASAGVAVSLALQGSLTNLAGGVQILLLKPFVVGDYIQEDTNGNAGTVQEIHIFYTKLSTLDNRTIIIPNGTLANTSLTNGTANDTRLLDLKVGISYTSDLQKAKALLEELLLSDPAILKDQPHMVFVDELADSAVRLGLRAKVPTPDYFAARCRLLENIKLTFDANGIEIPFTQLDVHIRQ